MDVQCRAQPVRRSAAAIPEKLKVLHVRGSVGSPGLIVPVHLEVDAVKALEWSELERAVDSQVVLHVGVG